MSHIICIITPNVQKIGCNFYRVLGIRGAPKRKVDYFGDLSFGFKFLKRIPDFRSELHRTPFIPINFQEENQHIFYALLYVV